MSPVRGACIKRCGWRRRTRHRCAPARRRHRDRRSSGPPRCRRRAPGARVTMRTLPRPSASSLRTSARSGGLSRSGGCAPARSGDSQGPSRCTPARSPDSTSEATWDSCASRAGRRGRHQAGDRQRSCPVARWCVTAVRTASSLPSANEAPPPPCTWTSTSPGMSVATVRALARIEIAGSDPADAGAVHLQPAGFENG